MDQDFLVVLSWFEEQVVSVEQVVWSGKQLEMDIMGEGEDNLEKGAEHLLLLDPELEGMVESYFEGVVVGLVR